jgi:hypothetical protein
MKTAIQMLYSDEGIKLIRPSCKKVEKNGPMAIFWGKFLNIHKDGQNCQNVTKQNLVASSLEKDEILNRLIFINVKL